MFGLGAAFAVPAAVISPFNAAAGLALAVGTLPAAMTRLNPGRAHRWLIVVVGGVAGLSVFIGSVLRQVPIVAVIALFVVGFVVPFWAARRRAGALVMGLALPVMGIGLSVTSVSSGLLLGGLMLLGSVWAWGVSLLWPEQTVSPPQPPRPPAPRRAVVGYGILLGAAGALAATTAFLLHLEHVGWVTGACLLVMRPARSMLFLRSAGRALSVFVGALLAALFALGSPGWLLTAIVIVLALAGATATRGSHWYVTPAFGTFLALSLILSTAAGGTPAQRFAERMLETLLGIGIALLFGWVIPMLFRMRRGPGRSLSA